MAMGCEMSRQLIELLDFTGTAPVTNTFPLCSRSMQVLAVTRIRFMAPEHLPPLPKTQIWKIFLLQTKSSRKCAQLDSTVCETVSSEHKSTPGRQQLRTA